MGTTVYEPPSDFYVEKYAEFRERLCATDRCIDFVQYDWLPVPNTISLDSRYGIQKMVYLKKAQDAVRDLANGINHLINLTAKLTAWRIVLGNVGLEQKYLLFHEFVNDLSALALNTPYSLRERFFFAVAHLSHQANAARDGDTWVDTLKTLPDDHAISPKWAAKVASGWSAWGDLSQALENVNNDAFTTATKGFRNKMTHRAVPGIEFGITQTVSRISEAGNQNMRYHFGGSTPLVLEDILSALKDQCRHLNSSYAALQDLIAEQSLVLFSSPTATR